MYDEINFEKIDLSLEPPAKEPERQHYFIAKLRRYVEAERKRLDRSVTCAVVTFGCQMNARDSEKLSGILETAGYELTEMKMRILSFTIPARCGITPTSVCTGGWGI